MKIIQDIAFVLHDDWRKTRLKEDGTFEPRWKDVKDEQFVKNLESLETLPNNIRQGENGFEIDIANTCFHDLSAFWQKENLIAAELAYNLAQENSERPLEEAGNIIHNEWLERNPWEKGGELDVPFSELSAEEQSKDVRQFEIAKTMISAYPEVITDKNISVKNLVEYMSSLNSNGYNVVIQIQDLNLYSLLDDKRTIIEKINSFIEKNRDYYLNQDQTIETQQTQEDDYQL